MTAEFGLSSGLAANSLNHRVCVLEICARRNQGTWTEPQPVREVVGIIPFVILTKRKRMMVGQTRRHLVTCESEQN